MPAANRFRHQQYTAAHPTSPFHLIAPEVPDKSDTRARMRQIGDAYRRAGVAAIYLAHGTFVGLDPAGLICELGRLLPAGSEQLQQWTKAIADASLADFGNYTAEYAREFQAAINRQGQPHIPVRIFRWSSENNHIGRADGAVRLIDELMRAGFQSGERVLLWGHSHAGNVLALMSNLLAGDYETNNAFFTAARPYYRCPGLGWIDIPLWNRTRHRLTGETNPLAGITLDCVTFGTPIRYGWDTGGIGKLLHFVNHRPQPHGAPFRASLPSGLRDLEKATGGDYVQQAGIAGTNVVPNVFAWRAWLADRRLRQLLEANLAEPSLQQRLTTGRRVPDDGETLLVDYGPPEGHLVQHLAGHGVYTRRPWLPFHAEQVATRLYGFKSNGNAARCA